jgi:hypothetical protein
MIYHKGIEIDRVNRIIAHRGRVHQFQRRPHMVTFEMICSLLLAGPQSLPELFDSVYGHLKDGGPLSHGRIFETMFHQRAPLFRHLCLVLKRERGSGRMRYWLEPAS